MPEQTHIKMVEKVYSNITDKLSKSKKLSELLLEIEKKIKEDLDPMEPGEVRVPENKPNTIQNWNDEDEEEGEATTDKVDAKEEPMAQPENPIPHSETTTTEVQHQTKKQNPDSKKQRRITQALQQQVALTAETTRVTKTPAKKATAENPQPEKKVSKKELEKLENALLEEYMQSAKETQKNKKAAPPAHHCNVLTTASEAVRKLYLGNGINAGCKPWLERFIITLEELTDKNDPLFELKDDILPDLRVLCDNLNFMTAAHANDENHYMWVYFIHQFLKESLIKNCETKPVLKSAKKDPRAKDLLPMLNQLQESYVSYRNDLKVMEKFFSISNALFFVMHTAEFAKFKYPSIDLLRQLYLRKINEAVHTNLNWSKLDSDDISKIIPELEMIKLEIIAGLKQEIDSHDKSEIDFIREYPFLQSAHLSIVFLRHLQTTESSHQPIPHVVTPVITRTLTDVVKALIAIHLNHKTKLDELVLTLQKLELTPTYFSLARDIRCGLSILRSNLRYVEKDSELATWIWFIYNYSVYLSSGLATQRDGIARSNLEEFDRIAKPQIFFDFLNAINNSCIEHKKDVIGLSEQVQPFLVLTRIYVLLQHYEWEMYNPLFATSELLKLYPVCANDIRFFYIAKNKKLMEGKGNPVQDDITKLTHIQKQFEEIKEKMIDTVIKNYQSRVFQHDSQLEVLKTAIENFKKNQPDFDFSKHPIIRKMAASAEEINKIIILIEGLSLLIQKLQQQIQPSSPATSRAALFAIGGTQAARSQPAAAQSQPPASSARL